MLLCKNPQTHTVRRTGCFASRCLLPSAIQPPGERPPQFTEEEHPGQHTERHAAEGDEELLRVHRPGPTQRQRRAPGHAPDHAEGGHHARAQPARAEPGGQRRRQHRWQRLVGKMVGQLTNGFIFIENQQRAFATIPQLAPCAKPIAAPARPSR